jgi:uncharacterized protein
MSALHTKLQVELNAARKAQDKPLVLLLGTMLSDIKNRRIELRRDPEDAEVLEVLQKGIKRRRESVEAYEKAAREDLAAREREEIRLLQRYLPPEASDDDIRAAVREAIGAGDRRGRDADRRRDGQSDAAFQRACGREPDQRDRARGAQSTRVTVVMLDVSGARTSESERWFGFFVRTVASWRNEPVASCRDEPKARWRDEPKARWQNEPEARWR